jgi:hypothetical protein
MTNDCNGVIPNPTGPTFSPGTGRVLDAIRLERRPIFSLCARADLVIDASNLIAAQLKPLLTGRFARDLAGIRDFITSFSYLEGLPREADLITAGWLAAQLPVAGARPELSHRELPHLGSLGPTPPGTLMVAS